LENSIIDYTMSTVDNVVEAKELYEGVKSIYSACSMKLHKIASNSEELLSSIPDVEKAKGFHSEDFLSGQQAKENEVGDAGPGALRGIHGGQHSMEEAREY
jgi:hypothetical protein